ncbi:MAG: methionyl-tRNA formyltransferase [Thermoanaerobaculia bacterium]|nr:methionyl-tRNA formyltransferase [Thermoanaerobaculia bacterium]
MRIVFFGTPEFAVPALEAIDGSPHDVLLVVAQPDRPSGRGMKMSKPAAAEKAIELGLSIRQPEKIRSDEFLRSVRELRPDIGVVIAYGKILPKELLEIPKHGFVNVHASLLPKFRGAAPIQRAIECGLRRTGVTIMQVDEQLDHGPILSTRTATIESDERAPEVFSKLAEIGAELLVDTLDQIEQGEVTPEEQAHSKATLAPMIDKHEGEIDLSMPAKTIYDRFRAFWPWPGLSVHAGDERLKLIEIAPEEGNAEEKPGTILEIGDDYVVVATGKGRLRLREVQRPGRRSVSAADYVRGRRLEAGMSIL